MSLRDEREECSTLRHAHSLSAVLSSEQREAEDIEEVENADNNKSSNLEANRRLSKTDENCTSVQRTNIRDRQPIEATSDVIEISGDNSDDGHGEKEITKSGKTIIFYSSHY